MARRGFCAPSSWSKHTAMCTGGPSTSVTWNFFSIGFNLTPDSRIPGKRLLAKLQCADMPATVLWGAMRQRRQYVLLSHSLNLGSTFKRRILSSPGHGESCARSRLAHDPDPLLARRTQLGNHSPDAR